LSTHKADSAHRVHSRLAGEKFDAMSGAALDHVRKFREYLAGIR
jgi:hypothetical protein